MAKHAPAPERFWAKVAITDGCWYWTGAKMPAGYGTFKVVVGNRHELTHRYSYEQCVGPIPKGLQLDHLCQVRCCVRPDHLEPVTPRVNVVRSVAAGTPANKPLASVPPAKPLPSPSRKNAARPGVRIRGAGKEQTCDFFIEYHQRPA